MCATAINTATAAVTSTATNNKTQTLQLLLLPPKLNEQSKMF